MSRVLEDEPSRAADESRSPSGDAPASRAGRAHSLRLDDGEKEAALPQFQLLRMLGWLAVIGLLTGGGYAAYNYYAQRQAQAPVAEAPPAKVASTPPASSLLLSLSGKIIPKTRIKVTPQIAGTIVEMPIEAGTRVRQGDLLLRIEDTNYRADHEQALAGLTTAQSRLNELKEGAREEEIEQAQAVLDQARSVVEFAKKALQRGHEAGDSISVSMRDRLQADFEQAEANARALEQSLQLLENGATVHSIVVAEAEVMRAEALVEKAKFLWDQTRIMAPVDGTVLEVNAEVGEAVRLEALGQSICVLADLSEMEATVEVPERELHRVKVGHNCRVIPDAYPDQRYEARLDRLVPQVNSQKGVVETRITILDADDYLLPQMSCMVEFLNEEEE